MPKLLRSICCTVTLWAVVSCGGGGGHAPGQDPGVPGVTRWQDMGSVLSAGSPGAWDARLTGMISPCTAIKLNGTYFLYYLGANGDRTTDGGPAFRALGVATSTDGVHFEKYSGNPVLTYTPHNNQEEGIFSAASSIDEQGNIALHYGAMWAANATTQSVHASIALATSADGLHFTDQGSVVAWDDPGVWGYGDELFPVGSVRSDNAWYVYYIAKGNAVPHWSLGLASGPAAAQLPTTQAVVSELNFFCSGGDPVLLDSDTLALFIQAHGPDCTIEARTAPLAAPAQLSGPVATFDFGTEIDNLTVYLDADSGTWFMYYLSAQGDSIRVKTAPATR
jgi:hypothetical protein